MKIYFIRHTEADDDRRDSFGGIADDPLIESGEIYAKKVGKALVNKRINIIYSSPYIRAKKTAELINESLNIKIVEIYNLRERNSYGVLSGIEKVKAKELFPSIMLRIDQMKRKGLKPSNSIETLPGAEIYLDLLLRVKDAIEQILRECDNLKFNNIVIVTHGGIASAFFNDLLNIPIELEKGEIIVLEGDSLNELKINEKETKDIKKELVS